MNHIGILALFALVISTNAHSSISCTKPTIKKSGGQDSVYHFKSEVTCTIKDEKINLAVLKDEYKEEILNPKSQFKVHSQKTYDKNDLHGYSFDVTQSYDTKHGFASVRAIILLLDDASKKFFMELRSKNVSGEGEESYNKSILNQTTLEILPDHAELTVVKEIDVEEPWYAPDEMFFGPVESELKDATSKSALLNAEKISGQKVEALRK